jgi:hypothetical protein
MSFQNIQIHTTPTAAAASLQQGEISRQVYDGLERNDLCVNEMAEMPLKLLKT